MENVHDHLKHGSIELSMLMEYMLKSRVQMKKNIAALLPQIIALVFDECSGGSTLYTAVFVLFPTHNELRNAALLPILPPVQDEIDFGSKEHVTYLDYVLELFN